MCKGEDQALEEGWMIPSWSMCSNSCLVVQSRSGAMRLGQAETVAPVVSIDELYQQVGQIISKNQHQGWASEHQQ